LLIFVPSPTQDRTKKAPIGVEESVGALGTVFTARKVIPFNPLPSHGFKAYSHLQSRILWFRIAAQIKRNFPYSYKEFTEVQEKSRGFRPSQAEVEVKVGSKKVLGCCCAAVVLRGKRPMG
jgi:hypothetical protein